MPSDEIEPTADVVIAGAGIAGLSAAQVLADAGLKVRVLEKASAPGGRCASYFDETLGHTVEHGIHGIFPRYVNLMRLWSDAGIPDTIYTTTRTTGMASAKGEMRGTELKSARGPAPFFLLGMTPRGVLRWRDYLFSLRFLLRTYAARWRRAKLLDATTFAAMLRDTGVSARMARLLLVPYVRNLSYARGDEVNAQIAVDALTYYVVEEADAVKARWIDGGPSELVFEPWQRALEARGVRFEYGQPVESIAMDGARFVGFGTQAMLSDSALGSAARLWTERIGHHHLALSWQPEARRLRAFQVACTHRGCPVQAQTNAEPAHFLCPCHGGKFDAEGQVLGGPPSQPLEEVPLQYDRQVGAWFLGDPGPGVAASDDGLVRARYGIAAMDLHAFQQVLPRALALHPATEGVPLLRTTSVIVMRLHFRVLPGQSKWSGPDSGVFAADDLLDNFFALHTFQAEFARFEDLILECHIGGSERFRALGDEDVQQQALDVLCRYFPDERLRERFDPSRARILRHEDAFPLFAPGDGARLPTVSHADRPNLMLAGDWIVPDDPEHRSFFMERAAVTGIEAANAILRSMGLPEKQRPIATHRSPLLSRLVAIPYRSFDALRRAWRWLFGVDQEQ